MIGLYIHVPFCRTLCPYCDFVRLPIAGAVPSAYADAVCQEIESFHGPDDAHTVFLGGGTPSLLDPGTLAAILESVRLRFKLCGPEITIEANPDDVEPVLADAWKDLGINRVSLGVQSFDDAVLRYLGRRHDADEARRACGIVAERFDNWGMDLIFGAHPIVSWDATLACCAALAPRHVSAYGLTYEEGTPFHARRSDAVDDDVWLDLYRRASGRLTGYAHYEVSNFARPGFACRHNLIYWRNEEYAGFGPAAYSFLGGVRSRNHVALERYFDAPGSKCEALELSGAEIRVETLIQHFRLKEGLRVQEYEGRFGRSVVEDYGSRIAALVSRGLLVQDAGAIRPTSKGFELNNEIGLALFL